MDEEEIRGWLRLVASGGKAAEQGMERLFRLYGARIKAFLRRHRMSEEEASDLLQETFIKIYRSADSFQGQSKVSTWIWIIARNTMLDHLRSYRQIESFDELLERGDGVEAALNAWHDEDAPYVRDCVQHGFMAFSGEHPERAQVLRLVAFEGWDMGELAVFLSRTPAATREYISQCRKKLAPFLEHCREWLEA